MLAAAAASCLSPYPSPLPLARPGRWLDFFQHRQLALGWIQGWLIHQLLPQLCGIKIPVQTRVLMVRRRRRSGEWMVGRGTVWENREMLVKGYKLSVIR